jgi:coenzyme F420 hydrogenase subunit beta
VNFEKKSFKIIKETSKKKRKNVTFISEKSSPLCLDDVLDNDLCCGCGTCVGACPFNILDIDLGSIQNPYLVEDCTECGICSDACPALEVDLFSVRERAVEEGISIDPIYGSYIEFFLGYHTNSNKRLNSASGGVATAILEYMLDTNQVDCVVVIGMNNEFPELKIVRNSKDVAQSQQSKYGYIPLGVVWTELRKTKESFAFVGLPCHISGFNKTANIYKSLKKQCKLKIGLFCGYSQTYDNIELFKYQTEAKEGIFKGWREGPYPGGVHIDNKLIPYNKMMNISIPFYTMQRCLSCEDGLAEEADIVLGDSHRSGDDKNMILTRTKLGNRILIEVKEHKYIEYENITKEEADGGTIGAVARVKGSHAYAYNKMRKKLGFQTVNFNITKTFSKKLFIVGTVKSVILSLSNKYFVKWFGFNKYIGVFGYIFYNFPASIKWNKKNIKNIKSAYKEVYIEYEKK